MRLTTSKYTSKNFDLNIELKAIASQMKQSAGYDCIFLDGFLDWLFNKRLRLILVTFIIIIPFLLLV